MDKRKTYFLIIDVETAGGIDNPLVYDLGFAIIDKKGNIQVARSFIIEEIWNQKSLMQSAYYANKIPQYEEKLASDEMQKVGWSQAIGTMNQIATHWNAKHVTAYNLAFDKKAMANTHKHLGNTGKVLSEKLKGIKHLCIWGMACETIFSQKNYSEVAVKQNWVSPAGNIRTNAEVAYRYITGDYNFKEAHTGLEDVKIEAKIMAKCFDQHQKMSKGIISHPWKIPQKK